MAETSSPEKFAGTTVNERLSAANLLDDFDQAARRRDRERMIDILRKVAVHTPERTVDMILQNPGAYGF